MVLREVVRIDKGLCDGCGECVPACAEGAIAIVDGKAALIDDALCDGLGACLGHCPRGAITVVQRRAFPSDATVVEDPHLDGREVGLAYGQACPVIPVRGPEPVAAEGCPGTKTMAIAYPAIGGAGEGMGSIGASQLRHWPVQLHLVPPTAPFYRHADVLLAADCSAFAAGDFHARFLHERAVAIACPKLDQKQERYIEKLVAMIDLAGIRSLTVLVMEVPCCRGLVELARAALSRCEQAPPVTAVVLSATGAVLAEEAVLVSG